MYQNENYRQMLYLSHLIWLAYYEAEQPPAARDYFRGMGGHSLQDQYKTTR
jgi:hypothetical protein